MRGGGILAAGLILVLLWALLMVVARYMPRVPTLPRVERIVTVEGE